MRVEPAVDHLVRAVLLRQQTQVRLDHDAAAQAQGRLERAVAVVGQQTKSEPRWKSFTG